MAMLDHLDAIKSIPGYKIILNAVIKGQIQQLVEQLSYHSNEECILLTANVADGTLTHMGSESGKGFIQDHEDIKSQFLQFCFKDSHMKQQVANTTRNSVSPSSTHNKMEATNTVKSNSLNDVSLMQTRITVNSRRKPYTSARSRRKLPAPTNMRASAERVPVTPVDNSGIKSELVETLSIPPLDGTATMVTEANMNETDSSLNALYLKLESQKSVTEESATFQPNFESRVNNIAVDGVELASLPVDLSEITKNDWSMRKESRSQFDDDIVNNILKNTTDLVEVKQEPMLQQFVSGSDTDTLSSPVGGKNGSQMKVYSCDLCGKPFPSKWELGRHRRTHTGEKPYNCQYCSKAFGDKSNMTQHIKSVHFREPIRRKGSTDNCSIMKNVF